MALRDDPAAITSLVHTSALESDEEDEPLWFKEIQREDKDDGGNGNCFVLISCFIVRPKVCCIIWNSGCWYIVESSSSDANKASAVPVADDMTNVMQKSIVFYPDSPFLEPAMSEAQLERGLS